MSLLNESSTLNPFTPPDSAGVRTRGISPPAAQRPWTHPARIENVRVTVRDVENKLVRA